MNKIKTKSELPIWLLVTLFVVLVLCALIMLAGDIGSYLDKKKRNQFVANEQTYLKSPQVEQGESYQKVEPVKGSASNSNDAKLKDSSQVVEEAVEQTSAVVGIQTISEPDIKKIEEIAFNQASKPTGINTLNNKAKQPPFEASIEKRNIVESKEDSAFDRGERWLESQPRENYSLQLASFRDEQSMLIYIKQQLNLKDQELHQLESNNGWFYLLHGSYPDAVSARKDKLRLSSGQSAWIRNIGDLRSKRCQSKGNEQSNSKC